MFNNRKIKYLRSLPEGNNIILIWVMLLTIAGRCNTSGMIFLTENVPYTTKMLAKELDFEENTIILAINALVQLGMIDYYNENLLITGWEEHQNIDGLEKIREQARKRQAKLRSKQKLLSDSNATHNVTVTQGNAIELDKEIEIDIDNKEHSLAYEKKYANDSFEMKCVNYLINSIASEMPNAKIPDNDKSIDDWCDHVEKMKRLDKQSEADIWSTLLYATSDNFWKSNIRSTKKFREKYETLFLQSKNKKNTKPQTQSTNKFNQFPQRVYSQTDYSSLEQRLLNKG
jgi:predicted phage replisome organizer